MSTRFLGPLLAALLLSIPSRAGVEEDYIVVVHKDSTVSELSSGQLRKIFTGSAQRWEDGEKIEPVLSRARSESLLQELLGVTDSEAEQAWLRLSLQGRGDPPVLVSTDAEALDFVTKHSAGIAIVARAELGADVKELSVVEGPKGCQK